MTLFEDFAGPWFTLFALFCTLIEDVSFLCVLKKHPKVLLRFLEDFFLIASFWSPVESLVPKISFNFLSNFNEIKRNLLGEPRTVLG